MVRAGARRRSHGVPAGVQSSGPRKRATLQASCCEPSLTKFTKAFANDSEQKATFDHWKRYVTMVGDSKASRGTIRGDCEEPAMAEGSR